MRLGSSFRFLAVVCVAGCGSAEPEAPPAAGESSASDLPATSTETPAEIESPTEPETPQELPEVNLLTAVETSLTVSSVYRGHNTQVVRLVDGDPETAWNSDSGDLVGAYIRVHVPESATVTGARIIVGFTHESRGRDLFTANQRVTKVKVTRGGETVGEFELDPSRRDLQSMVFAGLGGEYRFEITGVLAGSNEDWREICISEFELLGTSPDPSEGRLPRLSVDQTGEPHEPDEMETDERSLEVAAEPPRPGRSMSGYERQAHYFEETWVVLENLLFNMAARPVREDELMNHRRTALRRLAVFASPGGATDALQLALTSPIDWTDAPERTRRLSADLAAIDVAMRALNEWLNRDEARCRWARAMGAVRIRRVMNHVDHADFRRELGGHELNWSGDTRGAAARIKRMERPGATGVTNDWNDMMAQIAACESTCGWQ